MIKHLSIILLLLAPSLFYAQDKGSIAGKLLDKEFNNEPLPFANILVKGTLKGVSSDINGAYRIDNLDPGTYTLQYSFVGFETQDINVTVFAGKTSQVDVTMAAGGISQLDDVEIVVSSTKESVAALLLDQKKATEIKQSIGAEQMSNQAVSDASGAVAKISGVSKQEGSSNVYVRGLGDRYLNTTLNGLSLPSNNINKKNIDLSLFSSDVIQNISISKAYSSKFYGDFSAGNIDVVSKDFTGKTFFDISIGSGINTRAVDKDFVRSEGTGYFGYYGRHNRSPFAVLLSHGVDPVDGGTPVNLSLSASTGTTFKFDNGSRLSLFATGSFGNDYKYRKGSTVDYTVFENKAFPEAEEFEYNTTTTALANINYKFNADHNFKFTSLFVNSSSDAVGYYGIGGNGRNSDAFINTDKGFFVSNTQFNQDLIFVNQLKGKHSLGLKEVTDGDFEKKIEVDWGMGYNKVYSYEPDRKRFSVENYDFSLDQDPLTNATFYNNNPYDNQRYSQKVIDEEFNGRFNLAFIASEAVTLNVGYNGRSKERNFENIRYGYDILDSGFPISNPKQLDTFFTLDNLSAGLYET